MSRSLTLIATDLAAVGRAAGSQDVALLNSLLSLNGSEALNAALRELMLTTSFQYESTPESLAEALECICVHFGRVLPNQSVAAISLAYMEQLDAKLREFGLGVTLFDVTYNQILSPKLPRADSFPSSGHWSALQVAQASVIYEQTQPEADDPELDQLLIDLGEGLRIAASRGWAIVGFYY